MAFRLNDSLVDKSQFKASKKPPIKKELDTTVKSFRFESCELVQAELQSAEESERTNQELKGKIKCLRL